MILPDQAAQLAQKWSGRISGELVVLTDGELAGLLNETILQVKQECAGQCQSATDADRIMSRA